MYTLFPSAIAVLLVAFQLPAQSVARLRANNVSIAETSYKSRTAIKLTATPGAALATAYAEVKDVRLRDGAIDVELADQPVPRAAETARGFIGIAFRLRETGAMSTSTLEGI